jgi:DNA-binding FrmR family transcriptional regulator
MTTRKISSKSKSNVESPLSSDPKAQPRQAAGVDPEIKASNLRRLRRIEGQVRGLQRMVEQDRYCADILGQVSSVQEALRSVARALMRNHLTHCATHAMQTGSEAEKHAMYDELLEIIYKNAR